MTLLFMSTMFRAASVKRGFKLVVFGKWSVNLIIQHNLCVSSAAGALEHPTHTHTLGNVNQLDECFSSQLFLLTANMYVELK